MGKASKWFRSILLLGFKKQDNNPSPPSHSQSTPTSEKKKRWNFVKSYREKECHPHHIQRSSLTAGFSLSVTDDNVVVDNDDVDDTKKHAMAVAEATKAVAEAAVAAAEAAAAVVRLTSSGRAISITSSTNNTTAFVSAKSASGYGDKEIWATVIIQSYFRAYLSRRALRALKALVRLQARFRGHIVRKDNANRLRRMQAMLRAQVRARTATNNAQQHFDSPLKSNQFNHSGPATPEKFEHMFRARSMKHGENLIYRSNGNMNNYCKTRMGSSNWMDSETDVLRSWEQINPRPEEKSDRILEVVLDNGKSQSAAAAVVRRRRRNLFHSCHLSLGSSEQCCSHSFTTSKDSAGGVGGGLSPSSCEVQSFISPMKFCEDVVDEEESYYAAADGGVCGGGTNNNRGGGPFTPTKSDCSRSGYSEYYYPSYMAYTESSKAKIRSLSAPKQRPQYEKTSPNTKRYSIHGYGDSRTTATAAVQQKVSSLHANFTNKVYPGSGRLDRLEMPITEELISFSGGHWHHRC